MALAGRNVYSGELIFFDLAVRGYRDRRPGLNALRETLPSKKFTVLFVFGTSRLFRKRHRAIRFVEEEIVEQKMHCVFIQQNIDTRVNKDWRLHLMIQAAIDENGTSMYAENIRAANKECSSGWKCTARCRSAITGSRSKEEA